MNKRPYRMTARAAAAAATADRILDATTEVFWEEPSDRISLDVIAARANVSVQTVIRRFGGREGLLAAAGAREQARVQAERDPGPAPAPADAVRRLVAHYERVGAGVLRLLGAEAGSPALREIADRGRTAHRAWCEAVFAAILDRLDPEPRRRRLAQLVAVCDVTTWQHLRHGAGLDPGTTTLAVLELVNPLLEAP